MIALLINGGNAQQLQICYKNVGSTMIQQPEKIDCQIPKASTIQPVEVNLYVKRRVPAEVEAIKCSAKMETKCKTTLFYKEIDGDTYEKTLEVSPGKCRKLADQYLKDNKEHQTSEIPKIEEKFVGEKCGTATNYFLTKGKIAHTPDGHLISDLSHLHGCDNNKEACEMETQTIIWEAFDPVQLCPYVKAGSYQGLLAHPSEDEPEVAYLILDALQAAFLFSTEPMEDKWNLKLKFNFRDCQQDPKENNL
uniref:Uncharacterized protein n=1 Tax=Panagrolaimus superbus TaxID=310955 RepID=A0A914Y4D3_9BILA